jgi:glycosyltransferase involved in cell wall biosynthesis
MQSYLGDYLGAASDRENKIIRAIESVINQTFKDWELLIIADGCEKTFDLVSSKYANNAKVNCFYIPKQPLWSGTARDIGKIEAKGEYCIYLDTDDYYSPDHLEKIISQFNGSDWVCFNDFVWTGTAWKERECNVKRIGQNGTSNICFKRELDVSWSGYTGYAHDFYFNQQLVKKYPNYVKIQTPGYYVCHLPPHPGGYNYDI